MNLDARLKEFKDFENDDQAFWDKVIGGEEPEVSQAVRDGSTRLRSGERVVVHGEIIDSLWEEDFITLEDAHIIEDLRERMTLMGLDPSHVEEMVKKAKQSALRKHAATEPFPILPQKQWEELKRRVSEQGARLAKILLNHVELESGGTEIAYKYKTLRIISGKNNYVCALMMVNQQIKDELGTTRQDASSEEFKELLDNLDDKILQPLVRKLRKAKSDYEQSKA